MTLVPDPVSAALARTTPYPYHRVHRALGLLAAQRWTPEQAAAHVRALAASGLPLTVPVLLRDPLAAPR